MGRDDREAIVADCAASPPANASDSTARSPLTCATAKNGRLLQRRNPRRERLLSWHGGHHHLNLIDGPLTMVGDALHVPTADHGLALVRPIGPEDTCFPATSVPGRPNSRA